MPIRRLLFAPVLLLICTTVIAAEPEMKSGDVSQARRIESKDPLTGRKLIELDSGPWFDYPLYFYIPTATADSKSVVFHRYRDGEVQYHRLDIDTGKVVCLTSARTPNCLWRPWDEAPATGVREFLGAFSPATNELVYFDSNDIRAVQIYTLKDRLVAKVPDDRVPCGLTGISPDGKHFVFPHIDRAWWDAHAKKPEPPRSEAKDVRIDVVDLDTGQMRNLVAINSWITHTSFYDNQRILFCHPATEQGPMMTDLRGGWYTMLRGQSADHRQIVHYLATATGVRYEYNTMDRIDRSQGMIGLISPITLDHAEYSLDARITHLGMDTEGRLWFGEQLVQPEIRRQLGYFASLRAGEKNHFIPLTEPMTTYSSGQRSHTHPLLMPGRRHILFTGGDPATKTNHLFLLDVSDVRDTAMDAAKQP